ncbi:hypothetical protein J2Z19_005339 [Ensifer adhaerens]|uniref:Uncharacterized protein n=1 Tax=Ensifer adhaerens TaxID=106592 RepID=A0ACC5T428_ENSAD|nr:FAD-dependent oxidoreductase [Ensifer adhaerens]MBP1875603.1 hypothetical protein [Ensifer adhaerens]
MTRANMADPQIVNKLRSGSEEQIRPCVGASHCLYRPVHCIHSPPTVRETRLPQVIERSPQAAGLAAAEVLAERGHRVALREATDRLGTRSGRESPASSRPDATQRPRLPRKSRRLARQ